jgi:hypothetical protein
MKITYFLLVIAALAFFACSTSKNNPDDSSSIPNETTDISSQVYILDKQNPNALNVPYTGNGVIKDIVIDINEGANERPIDTIEVGTIAGGKIDLKFDVPKKEHLSEEGGQIYYDLEPYDNTNNPVGRLILANFEDTNDSFIGLYAYYSDDYKYKNSWTHFQEYELKFVTDIDVKKGWNLIYENDKYDYENGKTILFTLTKTNNSDILNGRKLKWYLIPY